MEEVTYTDKWSINSKKYYDDEVYIWMESFVRDSKNILEIGCGAGYSTLSLAQTGHKVCVIERNVACIKKTKALLEKNNYRVQVIQSSNDEAGNFHLFDVIIMCANIHSYDNNSLYLLGKGYLKHLKIDTILIWLLGGFTEDEETKKVRFEIEDKVFFLAERLDKRQFKCLHYVERTTAKQFQCEYEGFKSIVNDFNRFYISEGKSLIYDYDITDGIPTSTNAKSDESNKQFISVIYYRIY